VKGNLVRGLPTKIFTNDNSCVACKKGKQHRASCKSKTDETTLVLKTFIIGLENLLSLKVKIIRCDNGTEFKNSDLNQFCRLKGIKREFSVPRTPQQNSIAERKNKTLIEAARTLLADSLLPIPFWAEAVNTACYVQNRVLVTKPHNKTPYELLHARLPSIGFMRPFGCPVTILNTLDPLCKFQEKVDEGFLVGYSMCSSGPAWLFDIDNLTRTMNYHLVITENQTNSNAGFQDTEKAGEEGTQTYVLFLVLSDGFTNSQNNNKDALNDGKEHDDDIQKSVSPDIHSSSSGFRDLNEEFKECNNNSSNGVNAASSLVSTARQNFINSTNDFSAAGPSNADMPNLEDLTHSDDADAIGVEDDINNLESIILTRSMARTVRDQGGISQMFDEDFHTCMFACFLSQEEPKRVHQALKDLNWIKAMHEELLQFKMQKVWILVDLPYGKRAIGTKWVYINKKDERGIVIRNKARLVAQGHTQEEGIDYEEVKQKKDGVFISQDKYVAEILKKFRLSKGKSASTPIDAEKPLLKDSDGEDVDVHTYRSMIGSLMYLTSSRQDIMFAVCVCARFQVTPKVSHLNAVKRIFRYLKGKPYLGLWYPKDSPFDLVAYSDSDYVGASLDRKSTTRGCQFIRCRLISWQCKKQTVVATSSTKAEYVAATSGCAQVLWIQNRLLDYGGSYIHYALTVNPHIYISCIKQFWNTASVKRSGDVTRLQALIDKKKIMISKNQVGDLSTYTTRFISPAFTQKVFANMRRVGKGFSGVETPLFEGMLAVRQPAEEGVAEAQVQADDAVADDVEENVFEDVPHDAIPLPPSHDIPSPSQEPSSPPQQPQSSPQAPPQGAEFPSQIQQVLNVCSALTKCVENLENYNAAQKLVIIKLKARVKKLEMANKGRMIDDIDKDEGIELVTDADIAESEERHATEQAEKQSEICHIDLDHSSKVLSMQEDDSEVQEVVEVVTTVMLIKEVVTAVLQVSAASATIFAAKSSIPVAAPTAFAAYTRRRKGVIIRDPEEELSLKTLAETPKVKDKGKAKRRKLSEEAQEAEDLRKRLEVVDDEDDDVFIKATLLARKVPVVDYQIVLVDNKPRFKIIKADETH
nr:putative ribonuclease H-like domain-containing protein [Tanacetum cinerariifolium]